MLIADLLGFVGRLHPLVVHLPIGTLVLALLLDLLALTKPARLALLVGFISAVVACVCGYLLSLTVSYDADTLDKHMYAGIVLAIASGGLYVFVVPPKAFTASLIAIVLLMAFTGHQGGTLTYGPDYFTREAKIDSVYLPVDDYDTLDMRPIETLRNEGVMVRVMLKRPLMLDVTITPDSKLNIDDLKAVAPNVIMFNAPDNNLHDVSFLRDLVNLQKLRLEKNPLGDEIVDDLLGLKHLVVVNLNETKITQAGVKKLRTNPSIQRVYTWRTKAE